jgi:hypothetical protein
MVKAIARERRIDQAKRVEMRIPEVSGRPAHSAQGARLAGFTPPHRVSIMTSARAGVAALASSFKSSSASSRFGSSRTSHTDRNDAIPDAAPHDHPGSLGQAGHHPLRGGDIEDHRCLGWVPLYRLAPASVRG